MIVKQSLASLLALVLVAATASAAEVRGVVTKLDPDKKELVLQGRGAGARGMVLDFVLGADVRVEFGIGRQPGQLADLAPGRSVRISFEVQDGRRVVQVIHVVGARPAGAVAPPGSPTAPSDPNTIAGVLRRVALTEREIVVILPAQAGMELETTLAVPEDVKCTRDQKPIPFEELKEGERVVVQTAKRDGGLVATSIQAGAVAVPAATAPPREDRIEKLRQVLKMVDHFLETQQRQQKQP